MTRTVTLVCVDSKANAATLFDALFGAVFEIEIVQLLFEGFVRMLNLFDFTLQTLIQIDACFLAPSERVRAILAVDAKQELAVLAPALIG